MEQVGIDVLFRGTTRNADGQLYKGNLNSIENGTSTSTDPIRAVIFGIESATYSRNKGFLQIYETRALKDLTLQVPNIRFKLELEIIVKANPENLSKFAVKEIPIEDARKAIEEVYGIKLDTRIDEDYSEYLLRSTPILTLNQALDFYKKINK